MFTGSLHGDKIFKFIFRLGLLLIQVSIDLNRGTAVRVPQDTLRFFCVHTGIIQHRGKVMPEDVGCQSVNGIRARTLISGSSLELPVNPVPEPAVNGF